MLQVYDDNQQSAESASLQLLAKGLDEPHFLLYSVFMPAFHGHHPTCKGSMVFLLDVTVRRLFPSLDRQIEYL